MERFGLLGTSIHHGGTAALAYYTLPPERLAETLPRLKEHCGFAEMVYLATCNRVEVVFSAGRARGPEERLSRFFEFFELERRAAGGQEGAPDVRPSFYLRRGEQAVWHLAEVAAGLDSLVVGESQILHQVKEAYETCFNLGLARADLTRLLHWVLHTAKEVRTQTGIAAGRVSMAGLVEERLNAHLRAADAPRLAIVGSGPMGEKVAQALRWLPGLELLWVNRSPAPAAELAARHGGRALPLADFLAAPTPCDALLTATAAPRPLFTRDALRAARRPGRRLLVADLAVPPDTAPGAGDGEAVEVILIDDLRRQGERNRQARRAERRKALPIIAAHIKELRDQLVERSVLPVLLEFRDGFLEQSRQDIAALLDGPLRDLGPSERRVIEKRINQIIKRNAHLLIAGLKEMATGCPAEAGALCCVGGFNTLGDLLRDDGEGREPREGRAAAGKGGRVS